MTVRVLALETATAACSAALYIAGEVRERHALAPQRHAALILPMIDALLAEAQLPVARLDGIAFGRGPGSFTGVRIATSVVQGVAFAADLPVVAISTLAALAQGAMRETGTDRVLAALDARMSEVYWGVYLQDSNAMARLQGEECACAPDRVPLPDGEAWTGAGSGWMTHADALRLCCGERVVRLLP
ncbi:MAG: tRNA (adenosine(37)-N6)-threonylcarbamoyltransferase complex dimerization subunit type 1 TsaB, partial [Gammaproteobacteria bacterium]